VVKVSPLVPLPALSRVIQEIRYLLIYLIQRSIRHFDYFHNAALRNFQFLEINKNG